MPPIKKWERQIDGSAAQLLCRIYGRCPVQAEGTVAGRPLYFRARHDAWSFSVSDSDDVNPVDIQLPFQGFLREGEYGWRGSFDAGYMEYDAAEAIIRRCSEEYLEALSP